jgi:hypothetical protein
MEPTNRKRPAGEAGRFWGYYRGRALGEGRGQARFGLPMRCYVRLSTVESGQKGGRLAHFWRIKGAGSKATPAEPVYRISTTRAAAKQSKLR